MEGGKGGKEGRRESPRASEIRDGGRKEEEWEAVGDYGDGGWGCFCCWPVSFRIFSFAKSFQVERFPGFE